MAVYVDDASTRPIFVASGTRARLAELDSLSAASTFARPSIRAEIGMMMRALMTRFCLANVGLFDEQSHVEQPSFA
jgi:hypothetical protein